MSGPYWQIKAAGEAAPGAPPEILIYGDIGDTWDAESTTAADLVRALGEIDAPDLTVRINSYGGAVSDALAIYNGLRRHPAQVMVAIDGVAVSAASLIAMAGDLVTMADNALMMIHAPWGMSVGNARDMRDSADVLDKYALAMSSAYAAKTGRPREEMLALLSDGEDHWMTADEALAGRFVDETIESQMQVAASLRAAARFHPPARIAAHYRPETPTMTDKTPTAPPADPKPRTEPHIDINAKTDEIRRAEQTRIRELNAYAKQWPELSGDVDQAISQGTSVEAFARAAMSKLGESRPTDTSAAHSGWVGMEGREVQKYSLVKALNAYLANDWRAAGLELEASQAVAEQVGREPKGLFVPMDVQMRQISAVRPRATVLTVQQDSRGGYLVPAIPGSFIELLRERTRVMELGATVLPDLVGDLPLPKQTAGATFYWVGEDDNVTDDTTTAFGVVTLSPKTVGGAVPISRKLLKQSSPAVEGLVMDDLTIGAALAIDLAAIQGTGVNGQPRGIVNMTSVNTQSVSSAGAPTWAEVVGFETAVDTDKALAGSLAYLTTPAVRGSMKTTSKDTGSGLFLWDGGEVNGYRAESSTQVPTSGIIFGNWADLVIGMWGVLDVMPDTSTKAASGGLVLRVFQDVDLLARHEVSFCINA